MQENFHNVQMKTDKELVLLRPEVNIGSIDIAQELQWVLNAAGTQMERVVIPFVPGLLKLFDEAIVNAKDHSARMASIAEGENAARVTYIHVTVDETTKMISIANDGNGMDIAKYPDTDIWIPEIAFGHLRSSTHYDDKEDTNTFGGQNGLGIKLAYIWSTYGEIETVDHIRGLKYHQIFRNNLDIIEPPTITKTKKNAKPYTKITFLPDYTRFNFTLSPEMIRLFMRRTWDIAAVTDETVKVQFNGVKLPVRKFTQYADMFLGGKRTDGGSIRFSDISENGRWEYVIASSPTREFTQVSFVNGICTYKGGKHVDWIADQFVAGLVQYIEQKKKIKVRTSTIREQLFLLVRCDIVKPKFESQTKEQLTTPFAQLRSQGAITVSDAMIEKVAKQLGIMDVACAVTNAVSDKSIAKQVDGSKVKTLTLDGLDDANHAGTIKSNNCTLMICEGDSAHTAIISGLSQEDRNWIGVYAIKGKLENVRDVTKKKADKLNPYSEEVTDIIKILGLKLGVKYTSTDSLRYGHVILVTDQDLDGSHIKGLSINLFHSKWPELSRLPTFIGYMNTPIVKARPKRGNSTIYEFYNVGEFNAWKETHPIHDYNIKYYKGLGSSKKEEFQQYMKKKVFVTFGYTGEPCDDAIDMVFNKSRADERKQWIKNADPSTSLYANTQSREVTYYDFIHRELVWYSKYDCERSIPNIMDGLKPGQRKILYSCFKRNLIHAIKVAQLGGYVSENADYHHGEKSLTDTITKMAQAFVGSNGINLLQPEGQFGTRLEGGKDAASPRYTYTCLEPITHFIYSKDDSTIVTYLEDDGKLIEPQYYLPCVPMVLVNGSDGIGTGSSSDVPCYSLIEIMAYIRQRLLLPIGQEPIPRFDANPYYEGFTGTIAPTNESRIKFIIRGKYARVENEPDTICITELPIGMWTRSFILHLNKLGASDTKVFRSKPKTNNTDCIINTTIQFTSGLLDKLESEVSNGINGVEKLLKLTTSVHTNNMYLFNASGQLVKYDTIHDIMDEFITVRLDYYERRKQVIIAKLEEEICVISNEIRFIKAVISGEIELRDRPIADILRQLKEQGYATRNDDDGYNYLIDIKLRNITQEKRIQLEAKYTEKEEELQSWMSKTKYTIWLDDLDKLEVQFNAYVRKRNEGEKDLMLGSDNDDDDDVIIKPKSRPKGKKSNVH